MKKCVFAGCWNDAEFSADHTPFSGRTRRIDVCARCAEEIGVKPRWDSGVGFMPWFLCESMPVLWAEIEHRAAWGGCSRLDVLGEENTCL